MTSRFASLTEEDIEKMVEDKDSQNTKICRQIGNKIDTRNFVVLETLLRFENCSSSHCLLSSCRCIPHFIVLFSLGQSWLLVRGVAMGLCRRCVIFMSSCPRTLLPCHLATLLPCYLVTLLPCYPVILLPCYLVTLLPCYPVILLPCYPVILLPCYLVTLLTCYLVNLFPCYLVTLLPCYPVTLLPCSLVGTSCMGTYIVPTLPT